MKCPSCRSNKVRASIRRGLTESLFMRLFLFSPYRCKDCNLRFFSFAGIKALRTHREHKTLAGYLGLSGTNARRYQQMFGFIVIFLILLFVAIYMVNHLSTPSEPAP